MIYQSAVCQLSIAQPADAVGSPRWDYVIKRSHGDNLVEGNHQIRQFTAAGTQTSHPNLIAVLDVSTSSLAPYVVMPRLEGQTMQWYLDSGAPKPLPVALWFIRQIAQALSALHASGWVHGDVKPSNVMIGPRGHATLIDLGFASQIHTSANHQFRGTPKYAAPEKLQTQIAAMPSQDIYALGCVLKEWVDTKTETKANSLSQKVIDDLIRSMVAVDPRERPNAADLSRQLLSLEIDTLGGHIEPPKRRAA